jgi:hypothetical protein
VAFTESYHAVNRDRPLFEFRTAANGRVSPCDQAHKGDTGVPVLSREADKRRSMGQLLTDATVPYTSWFSARSPMSWSSREHRSAMTRGRRSRREEGKGEGKGEGGLRKRSNRRPIGLVLLLTRFRRYQVYSGSKLYVLSPFIPSAAQFPVIHRRRSCHASDSEII